MKTNIRFKFTGFVLLILTLSSGIISAQERVFMYLSYFQNDEGSFLLAETKYRKEREFIQLAGIDVEFYTVSDSGKTLLATIKTDSSGQSRFNLENRDSRISTFESLFKGNEAYGEASKDLTIHHLNMSLSAEWLDSVRTVKITASTDAEGEIVPVNDADVKLYVKRLFGDLPVAEGSFEEGSFETEFPGDIPGDGMGNLQLIARIEEHDLYGNVETRLKVDWGIPVSQTLEKNPRALWSRPPVWLILLVSLAFITAWYHYFLSISKLWKLKEHQT